MGPNHWFLFGGIFLLTLVLIDRWLKNGPISSAIIYLFFGLLLGPNFSGILKIDSFDQPHVMEIIAEIVVIISLFSAGLKLQIPFSQSHWKLSVVMATLTMTLTVAMIAGFGHLVFGLPLAAAVLLGGVLAPTDPVLASQVQVKDENDENRVRRGLTGEAGFNDGTAFPVIMLGLTLLGERWSGKDNPLAIWALADVLWAIFAGLAIGAFCGWAGAKLITSIHAGKNEKPIIEDFASIGLIGLAYGLAQVSSAYGFLAVFAAGVCFARYEKQAPGAPDSDGFSSSLIRFTTQLERLGEIATVIFVGYVAGRLDYSGAALLLPLVLICAIRPVAIFLSLGSLLPSKDKWIVSWFGIRGVGSIYYLYYAINHGFNGEHARTVFNLVLVTVVVSIVVHGVSGSPLMRMHNRRD